MTASNHFVTGAVIGVVVGNPWIGIPAAIASHFVLDAGPQYGYEGAAERRRLGFTLFQWVLALDIALFLVLIWMLTFITDTPELVIYGLAGYSPDLMWIHRFVVSEKLAHNLRPRMNRLQRLHASIQRLESPWGLLFEVPFFIGMCVLLIQITS